MEDPQAVAADAGYLICGATLDDESIGPRYTTAMEAHRLARTAIAGPGGTVRILRSGDTGWTEVARYTDTGRHLTRRRAAGDGWAVAADTDRAAG